MGGASPFTYIFSFTQESMKKIYFWASDFHLEGRPPEQLKRSNTHRAMALIRDDAAEIYLVGDVFEFWFVRIQNRGTQRVYPSVGKAGEPAGRGYPDLLFTGNHDM